MIRHGRLLHADLLGRLAAIGHTQTVVIADAGLPLPPGVPVVDLALTHGVPRFGAVLDAVLDTLVVESALVADELSGQPAQPAIHALLGSLPTARVPHERLKQLTAAASVIVRTGECTPYANVILTGGVDF